MTLLRIVTGSDLRGHHVPQRARVVSEGIDPTKATVVVLKNARHIAPRTYGAKGRTTARQEAGKPLSFSEKLDLADPPILSLGRAVAKKIGHLNRKTFPGQFE